MNRDLDEWSENICQALRIAGAKYAHEFDLVIYFYLAYQTHGNGD